MKLLTWNCQGAFRKKYSLVAALQPDLAVIQECEQPERIPWKLGRPPSGHLWFGQNPTRGLGIFSWTGFSFQESAIHDRSIQYCAPVEVTAPFSFHLVAVWTKEANHAKHSYSGQIYQALGLYREFILGADTAILGDYNSSPSTTPRSRMGNHPTLQIDLNDLWLVSAYHHFFHERQGKESRGTYFRSRRLDRPAHIDYAYIPTRWLRRLARVEVGDPASWLEYSDHCPILVEIREKGKGIIA